MKHDARYCQNDPNKKQFSPINSIPYATVDKFFHQDNTNVPHWFVHLIVLWVSTLPIYKTAKRTSPIDHNMNISLYDAPQWDRAPKIKSINIWLHLKMPTQIGTYFCSWKSKTWFHLTKGFQFQLLNKRLTPEAQKINTLKIIFKPVHIKITRLIKMFFIKFLSWSKPKIMVTAS